MEPVYNLPSDTPLHIRKMQTEIILKMTPGERLRMCTDMIDFSLKMLKRHVKLQHPDITDKRLKFEMIKLLYADCYDEEEMARIEQHFGEL